MDKFIVNLVEKVEGGHDVAPKEAILDPKYIPIDPSNRNVTKVTDKGIFTNKYDNSNKIDVGAIPISNNSDNSLTAVPDGLLVSRNDLSSKLKDPIVAKVKENISATLTANFNIARKEVDNKLKQLEKELDDLKPPVITEESLISLFNNSEYGEYSLPPDTPHYYVKIPGGSGDGTRSNPFGHLSNAMNAGGANSNAIIHLHAGTYGWNGWGYEFKDMPAIGGNAIKVITSYADPVIDDINVLREILIKNKNFRFWYDNNQKLFNRAFVNPAMWSSGHKQLDVRPYKQYLRDNATLVFRGCEINMSPIHNISEHYGDFGIKRHRRYKVNAPDSGFISGTPNTRVILENTVLSARKHWEKNVGDWTGFISGNHQGKIITHDILIRLDLLGEYRNTSIFAGKKVDYHSSGRKGKVLTKKDWGLRLPDTNIDYTTLEEIMKHHLGFKVGLG